MLRKLRVWLLAIAVLFSVSEAFGCRIEVRGESSLSCLPPVVQGFIFTAAVAAYGAHVAQAVGFYKAWEQLPVDRDLTWAVALEVIAHVAIAAPCFYPKAMAHLLLVGWLLTIDAGFVIPRDYLGKDADADTGLLASRWGQVAGIIAGGVALLAWATTGFKASK